MDHDKQIVPRGPEVVKMFLGERLASQENTVQIYSLNEEFARARKNRRPSVIFIILGFVFFLAVLSFGVRQLVEKRNQLVSFSIPDFEDLNLAELINTAKNAEERLNRVREELERSKMQMEEKLRALEADTQARIKAIAGRKNLSAKAKRELIRQLRQGQTAEKNTLRSKYQEQLAQRNQELSELEKKLNDYDKKLQDTARKNRVSLEKAKQDYRVQVSEQKSQYEKELREKAQQLKLIERKMDEYENRVAQFSANNRNFKEEIENLKKISETRQQDLELTRSQLETLQGNNEKMTQSLEKQSSKLAHYEYAVEYFSSKRRENGYVLDPRDPSRMIVAVNKNYAVTNGAKALVYDEKDEYVATIEFFYEDGELKARVLEKNQQRTIEPFYKILMKL